MSSPLKQHQKQNEINNQDTFDCSVSFQNKTQSFIKKKRVPGKLTTSKQLDLSSVQILDDLMLLKQNESLSNLHIFRQVQDIIGSLLHKNSTLLKDNTLLKKQNMQLKHQIRQLEEQIKLLTSDQNRNTGEFSIMSYFNNIGSVPIVQPIDGISYQLIEKNLCACKSDPNSNIRAFYLSMLQHKSTRRILNQLISEYQEDGSWKLVPLLPTNESWVQLSSNLFNILQSDDFYEVELIYNFINQSQLYDLIFISALRSRVGFLAQGYESQIESMELYTALCNIFGNQCISFDRKQHLKYDSYSFQMGDISFTIYFIEDLNQYAVSFYQPERLFSSVQSYNASTPRENSYVAEEMSERKSEYLSESSVLIKYCFQNQQ